jgi:hypothetical protein
LLVFFGESFESLRHFRFGSHIKIGLQDASGLHFLKRAARVPHIESLLVLLN